MALSTTADYQVVLNYVLWTMEDITGQSVGDYNQDGSVRISPWVFDMLRRGYTLTSTSNYPSGQSSEEAAAQADLTTIITAYLAAKKTREGLDTDNSGATLFH